LKLIFKLEILPLKIVEGVLLQFYLELEETFCEIPFIYISDWPGFPLVGFWNSDEKMLREPSGLGF
jgi:hypothetical protein